MKVLDLIKNNFGKEINDINKSEKTTWSSQKIEKEINDSNKWENTINDSKKYTDESISKLIGTSPEARDTIYELNDALKETEDTVGVLVDQISTKVPIDSISYIDNGRKYIGIFKVIEGMPIIEIKEV